MSMTLYIPPGYGHVIQSVKLLGDAQPMAITFGVKFAVATDTPAEVDTATLALADAFNVHLAPPMYVQYTSLQTEVIYRLAADAPTDPTRVSVANPAGGGASTDQPLPQNCSILIHKRTAHGGRRGRGRLYLQSPLEGSVDQNGALGSSYLSATQGHVTDWFDNLDGLGAFDGPMWLLHSTSLAIPLPADLPDPYVVTTLTVDPIIATQRRRLRK